MQNIFSVGCCPFATVTELNNYILSAIFIQDVWNWGEAFVSTYQNAAKPVKNRGVRNCVCVCARARTRARVDQSECST